jgi:hypothetical protein
MREHAVTGANATPPADHEPQPRPLDARLAADHAGGATEAASAAANPTEKMMESVGDAEFQIAVEVLYHGARRDFLLAAHRWAMFVAILAGASAAAPLAPTASGLVAAGAAAADMAFDFIGRAQAHADVRRRYLDLAAGLVADREETLEIWPARWMSITADEPPLYRWLAIVAHRNAAISLGREIPAPLPWWQRMLAQVWRG